MDEGLTSLSLERLMIAKLCFRNLPVELPYQVETP